MPDRRTKKGTLLDRAHGEPRTLHRADDIKTKWQFFAFAMQYFTKHWLKFIVLVSLIGLISFVILRYTDVISIIGGN